MELEEKVQTIMADVDSKSDMIERIVNEQVSLCCKELDNYIKWIHGILIDQMPPSNQELDDIAMRLPATMYFTSDRQELMGVKEDIAEAVRKELYNNTYSDVDGTVADKTAQAELQVQSETIAKIIYSRAYKKVKQRMEVAMKLLDSIKKVISHRMSDTELTGRV